MPTREDLRGDRRPGRCAAPRSARCWASCRAAARSCRRSPPIRSRRSCRARRSGSASGAIEGVAGPEAANNAGAQTSFIPMLTLGIPSNPVMALMIGALIIQGITPGPSVATEQPALFWGIIASMWIGNLLLVVLNLPLVGLWVQDPAGALLHAVPGDPRLLLDRRLQRRATTSSTCSRWPLFGLLGYVLVKLDCEPAPLLLGFVLGPMLEEHLRRAMIVARGDPVWLLTRPISGGLLRLGCGRARDRRAAGRVQEARGCVSGGMTRHPSRNVLHFRRAPQALGQSEPRHSLDIRTGVHWVHYI